METAQVPVDLPHRMPAILPIVALLAERHAPANTPDGGEAFQPFSRCSEIARELT
jgi:hypothetical protein